MIIWKKIFFRSNLLKLDANKKEQKNFKKQIENLIGYKPLRMSVFYECFTHSSFKNKNGNKNFERLEFLGDSLLSSVVSDYLYHQAPDKKEGYLTQMRSKMVNRRTLNVLGTELKLSSLLQKRQNTSLGEDIDGNLYEALIGAIYIDGGFELCRNFVKKTLIKHEDFKQLEKKITSYKGLIVEWAQKNKRKIDFETFQEENAEETLVFNSIIRLDNSIVAKGRAASKKKAEEDASKRAYYSLNKYINTSEES
ncbi:MAG: ribonuclease III [Flavobacteriaceae bacterium]|jgi:ribonuclease-3|nr:ribonuclease III [Flavobacteriaceae bacterium]